MQQTVIISANNNTNDFKLLAYEVTAPNTVVDTIDVLYPHTSSQSCTFLTLNNVTHIFRLFEWTGSAFGAMLWQEIVQPQQVNINTPNDIELVVGVDLPNNGTQWNGLTAYPQYAGYTLGTDFRVVQRGVSNLKLAEVQQFGGFGFELLGGQIFNNGDTYFIEFIPKLVVNPANYIGATNSNGYTDIVELNNSTVLNATYLNKLIDINHTIDGIAPTFKLPPIANWNDMSSIGFICNRGLAPNAIIELATGETIDFNFQQVNDIIIGHSEYLKITKKGSNLYVESTNIDYNSIGEFVQSYFDGFGLRYPHNHLLTNGNIQDRNIYVRLWRKLQLLSIGYGIVAEVNWAANQNMFSTGDGSTTFRMPLIANSSVLHNYIKI